MRSTPTTPVKPEGDEPSAGISNAKIRYNILSDYPWGISTNYTGTRARTRGAYPERNISWMKACLGLGKVKWTRHAYEWMASDEFQVVGASFSKELLKLLGKHSSFTLLCRIRSLDLRI